MTEVSRNVIDRRGAATHGVVALLAAAAGVLGARCSLPGAGDEDLVLEVSAALDRAQDYWSARVPGWRDARVVLIPRDGLPTPCGRADERSGPFYCPPDGRIYVDLAFLRAVDGRAARAYVIAHEIGHRVEHITRQMSSTIVAELGADCYAGAWMRDEQNAGRLDSGDLEGALALAAAVGDDRICPTCSPETWTHGSAEQRVAAVRRGLDGGDCR